MKHLRNISEKNPSASDGKKHDWEQFLKNDTPTGGGKLEKVPFNLEDYTSNPVKPNMSSSSTSIYLILKYRSYQNF
jgi:hypothetical protein